MLAPFSQIPLLDTVAECLAQNLCSQSEAELLAEIWQSGQDIRLREDLRFRPTPWGRWILSDHFLANDWLYQQFFENPVARLNLPEALDELKAAWGKACQFCPGDDRFVLQGMNLRLAAKELSDQPLIEDDVTELERFSTHLPVYSLKAAAASEPAGEWGQSAQSQAVETLGWIAIDLPGKQLNSKMFVARIQGHSMDDNSHRALKHRQYAVFEFWPAGSKQNLVVLVRGAFDDPETGAYAVKKYAGDMRNADGEHQEIRLISQNPDKTRFPDICLTPMDDDDLSVVAKLIQGLTPESFARQPKQHRVEGRRQLASQQTKERVFEKLSDQLNQFFEPESLEKTSDDTPKTPVRWACLDLEGGGLCLETDPLSEWMQTPLPSFIKRLNIQNNEETIAQVLVSNLKHRKTQNPVKPSYSAYIWSAPGFDDMLEENELQALEMPGLTPEAFFLFKVNARGIGYLMQGKELTTGKEYRLLLPPQTAAQFEDAKPLRGSDWKLWELVLPANPPPETIRTLENLGLAIGQAGLTSDWVITSPMAYLESPKGKQYSLFDASTNPCLQIKSSTPWRRKGEICIFLVSEKKQQALLLEAGNEWIIEFSDLKPGRYIVQILHERTYISPENLYFQITDHLPEAMKPHLELQPYSDKLVQLEDNTYILETNLQALPAELQNLQLHLPPFWPLYPRWNSGRWIHFETEKANANGFFDFALLMEAYQHHFRSAQIGTLNIQSPELGQIQLFHLHRIERNKLKEKLRQLYADCQASLHSIQHDWMYMKTLWLWPLLELMGYQPEQIPPEEWVKAPQGSQGIQLKIQERSDQAVSTQCDKTLIWVPSHVAWLESEQKTYQDWANQLCRDYHTATTVITDGIRWVNHKKNANRPFKEHFFDLEQDIEQDVSLNNFLYEMANQVIIEVEAE